MKLLEDATNYIQNLTKKDFEKYLTLFLVCVALLSGIYIYYIYNKSKSIINKIKFTEKLSLKTIRIIKNHQRMKLEEDKLQKLLKQNTDFNIKTYFEQFCSKHKVTPEPNWETSTRSFPGNDKFDEVSLFATFKNQSTQSLVEILDAFDKKEIVYVKEVSIKNEFNKTITVDITIATKKYKRG